MSKTCSFLRLKPDERAGHWRRGITCYYAKRFDEGRKQFEAYEEKDTNDVENAVWRYLCMARAEGVDKARASILKIGNDRRVPMMQVYALFAGKAKPEDVMASIKEGDPPVIARIEKDECCLDPRTVLRGEDETLLDAVEVAVASLK